MDRKPLKIGELTARIPVIHGGMGVGVSLGGLAGSVAAAGGVGVISTAQIGWREEDFKKNPMDANFRAVKKEIAKARELAQGGIIGVNIMVATQHYQDYVKTAVSAGIDLIISGAGLPIDLPRMVENTKTKIAPIVSSLKSLHVICKMWDRKYHRAPDLVVIEGPKAGGHLGFTKEELSDMEALDYDSVIRSIIRQTKEYEEKFGKEIPVVVAGGIFDREDMDHALSLGADICIVQSPVGMPGRAIKNVFMERVQAERQPIPYCYHCITTCKPKEIPYCITDALVQAVEGNVDNGLLFCGANAYRCRRLEHVKDIFQELA